jgi:hypothetical protein
LTLVVIARLNDGGRVRLPLAVATHWHNKIAETGGTDTSLASELGSNVVFSAALTSESDHQGSPLFVNGRLSYADLLGVVIGEPLIAANLPTAEVTACHHEIMRHSFAIA